MEYSIEDWVAEAPKDSATFRQAVHIILTAISSSDYLKPRMIMKGGILLGIRYKSSRFTTDIDFSSAEKLADINRDELVKELDEALAIASAELTYGIKCVVQSATIQPKDQNATFPSYNLKIGYASLENVGLMKRLDNRQSTSVIKIDYSLNEMTYNTDEINLEGEDDNSISAYSFTDLIAEKIRSTIQQPYRRRNRRQDIYDLHYLLSNCHKISTEEKLIILNSLLNKSIGRIPDGDVNIETLDREDIRSMSEENYHLLADEVADELPDFSVSYDGINSFYKSLPWDMV